jgi:protein-tyrosine phosphatase
MAMGLMRLKVQNEIDDWRIDSTGIWAQRGMPPAQFTLDVLQAKGIQLDKYGSKPLTVEMVQEFNLILTMENNHREALRFAFPGFSGKIFMLSQMVGKQDDIYDPIGGQLSEFEDLAKEIELILNQGFARIRKLAAGGKTASLSQH